MLVELLRAWFPTVAFGTDATVDLVRAATLLGVLAVPLLITAFPVRPRWWWWTGSGLLLLARLVTPLITAAPIRTVVLSAGVIGGVVAVMSVVAAGADRTGRVGVLAGAATGTWLPLLAGGSELIWRSDVAAVAAGAVLVVLVAVPVVRHPPPRQPVEGEPAWPWLLLGPALALLLLAVAVPGRLAIATGWVPAAVAAGSAAAAALVVLSAVAALGLPPRRAAPLAAVLVAVGGVSVAGSADLQVAAGQLVLATGLGLAIGCTGATAHRTSPRQRAVSGAVVWLVVAVLALAVEQGRNLASVLTPSALVLVTALLLALAVVAGRSPATHGTVRTTPALLALTLGVTAVLGAAGAAPAPPPVLAALPADQLPDDEAEQDPPGVRIGLVDVARGRTTDGRVDPRRLADELAALDLDVVVLTRVDRGWLIAGGQDPVPVLTDRLGMTVRSTVDGTALTATVLLSRLPVAESLAEPLPGGPDRRPRSQVTAVLQLPTGRPLGVVGTRLSSDPRGDEARLLQARASAAAIARLRERQVPVVLAGDLGGSDGGPEQAAFLPLLAPAIVGPPPPDDPGLPVPAGSTSQVLTSSDLEVLWTVTVSRPLLPGPALVASVSEPPG